MLFVRELEWFFHSMWGAWSYSPAWKSGALPNLLGSRSILYRHAFSIYRKWREAIFSGFKSWCRLSTCTCCVTFLVSCSLARQSWRIRSFPPCMSISNSCLSPVFWAKSSCTRLFARILLQCGVSPCLSIWLIRFTFNKPKSFNLHQLANVIVNDVLRVEWGWKCMQF